MRPFPPCLSDVRPLTLAVAAALALFTTPAAHADTASCAVQSGDQLTPVIELYTSEGCSSCPPADRWLSTLKGQNVVAQAFHVGYWDNLGWVDRFATPAHTARQREVAARNGLGNIYTPQLVRNGQDWRGRDRTMASTETAGARISLQRKPVAAGGPESFEARVTPIAPDASWSAYWTVTEHSHVSRVQAGENAGETLKHDYVVRQYVPVGRYQGAQTLAFVATPALAGHPRQVNLVVTDSRTGKPLQAVSLSCG